MKENLALSFPEIDTANFPGQDFRPLKAGVQQFRWKDRFVWRLRRPGDWVRVEVRFCTGRDEHPMIFVRHKFELQG
jgi:hypothetical protein